MSRLRHADLLLAALAAAAFAVIVGDALRLGSLWLDGISTGRVVPLLPGVNIAQPLADAMKLWWAVLWLRCLVFLTLCRGGFARQSRAHGVAGRHSAGKPARFFAVQAPPEGAPGTVTPVAGST